MDKRGVGALLQIALVVVGVPVVYVLAFPLEFTLKSFLPPVGLIVGLTTGGAMVRKTNQPVS